jgi:hypothetical protein
MKLGINGGPYQFKAKLVAWRCQQKQGFDYSNFYALMAKWHTIKAMSALARAKG